VVILDEAITLGEAGHYLGDFQVFPLNFSTLEGINERQSEDPVRGWSPRTRKPCPPTAINLLIHDPEIYFVDSTIDFLLFYFKRMDSQV
jgi:hypothetical protein